MDVSRILQTFNDHAVDYLLIGGMNFLLRHNGPMTLDVDVWIDDAPANRTRCEAALAALDAAWGEGEEDWGPVADKRPGWLARQGVFSLVSPHGCVDVFRAVAGMTVWADSASRAVVGHTHDNVPYRALCDADMAACQMALPEGERRQDRLRVLRRALGETT